MATKTLKIIDSSNLHSFSIKVSEPIGKKHLLDFLRTSILNKKLNLTKKTKFYYKFLADTLSYEIIVFDITSKNTLPEAFVCLPLCDPKNKELFIMKNYFCLFDKQELLLYKKIENIIQEDIQTYIEQLYKIKIDKVTVVDEKQLDNIKNNFKEKYKKYNFEFYCIEKSNSYYIFLTFVIVMFSSFIFFLYQTYQSHNDLLDSNDSFFKYEKGYKELLSIYKSSNKKIIEKIIVFANYCIEQNITIEKVDYLNDKLSIKLKDKNRKKLFETMRSYSSDIEISASEFDKIQKIYKVDIIIDVTK